MYGFCLSSLVGKLIF